MDLRRLRYYGHGGRSGYECMLADARRLAASAKVCAATECPHGPPRRTLSRVPRMPRTSVDHLSGRIGEAAYWPRSWPGRTLIVGTDSTTASSLPEAARANPEGPSRARRCLRSRDAKNNPTSQERFRHQRQPPSRLPGWLRVGRHDHDGYACCHWRVAWTTSPRRRWMLSAEGVDASANLRRHPLILGRNNASKGRDISSTAPSRTRYCRQLHCAGCRSSSARGE